jgi:hypothetical protein
LRQVLAADGENHGNDRADVSMAIIEMIIDRTAIIRWQVSSFADIPIAR